MHQAILMHTDVHKGSECDDVRDHAFQHHASQEVLRLRDVVAECRRHEALARIAARLPQLGHDVQQRRHAHIRADVRREVQRGQHRLVADQFLQRHAAVLGHACDEGVALGVHRAGIQRMRTAPHAQEASRLLECLGAEPRHVLQLLAGREATLGVTRGDDRLRQRRSHAGDVRQQLRRGGVHFHAHAVHAAFHDVVQALAKLRLVHVVLILPHADGLGVDLHQLGQRILQAARDGDGAADRHVEIWKFLARDVARRVDRCAGLTHDHDRRRGRLHLAQRGAHQRLGLA